MSNSFDSLPYEKRERIIDAAMTVFSMYGYHKASVMDIASSAGISKPMIFTYFGSKLGCYSFMCEEMLRVSVEEFTKFKDELFAIDDYFERILLSVKIKVGILKRYRSLLDFATSVYRERDDEALPIIKEVIEKGYSLREIFLSTGIDSSKFSCSMDASRVSKMVEWLSAGFADQWTRHSVNDLDKALEEFSECVILLKKRFYKKEYL